MKPSYRLICLALLLFFGAAGLSAQSVTVTGNLKDAEGTPLVGATTQQRGATTGTVADFDGNYSITVSGPQAVLIYSFTGW